MVDVLIADIDSNLAVDTASAGVAFTPGRGATLESISRPLLEVVHNLTGLEAAYLAEVRRREEQHIRFVSDRGQILVTEGTIVPWHDTLCRRALESGRRATADVESDLPGSEAATRLGLKTYVSVPVRADDGELLGTLCGASRTSMVLPPRVIDVMETLARLIADQWQRDRVHLAALQRAEAAETQLRDRTTRLAVAEHKLKSPLALLRGWSDILAENWSELPADVRDEALHTLQEAARDAVHQVDDLLRQARDDVRAKPSARTRVEMAPLVARIARQLQGIATAGHQVVLGTTVDAVVSADADALWQLLWHLGENAVKYSPQGGRIELALELGPPGFVVVHLSDEGVGLPEGVDVFAPFTRGVDTSAVSGAGLGLHIVHNLTHSIGGSLTASRREGAGSVFRVTLPLAD